MPGRFRLASPAMASVLGVVALLLLGAAVPLSILTHQFGWSDVPQLFFVVIPFAVVGVEFPRLSGVGLGGLFLFFHMIEVDLLVLGG